jgi:hypothetical protein
VGLLRSRGALRIGGTEARAGDLAMADISTEQLQEFMIREIAIVQRMIGRLESRSFLIKGWTIALVVAVLLIHASDHQALLAFIPILGFWVYDAYHVWQVRLYAKLHQWISENRLKVSEHLFDMSVHTFKETVPSVARTMFSGRVVWFYGCLLLLTGLHLVSSLLP